MLDIKFIRDNKDLVDAGAKKKRINFDVNKLIEVDDKRKELLQKVEELRAKQNEVSQKIPTANDNDKNIFLEEMKNVKVELLSFEEQLKPVMQEWQALMLQVPNIPDMSVPEGGEEDFIEVRTYGETPKFDFEIKDHVELMTKADMVDFERGVKVAGFRGYILKNDGALLQKAVENFVFDEMVKKGFNPLIVPSLVNKQTLLGTGYLPQGEDDLYKTQDSDYLSGTGEVPTISYYSDEVIQKEKLPIKFIAASPCFRREAGSHSKDTKGLIRVHEFYKLEQVILCEASHEETVKFHEEILANSEELMQKLGIPHRVILIAGGDLGLGQVKKYDIEAWVPSQNKYRETHSASYFHDFQTRRLNIKYQDGDKKRYTHSLNNTAMALPRILVPIVENYQQSDGRIKVPEVLVKYIGKEYLGKVTEYK
jgi:seryl-tRNA synthetase